MKLLKNLYEISSPSGGEKQMIRFITGRLKKSGIRYRVDGYGNIYAVKGNSETYPCIVAHTDEVHGMRSENYEAVTLRDEIIFGYDSKYKRFVGTGADDKNGIWVCLKCVRAAVPAEHIPVPVQDDVLPDDTCGVGRHHRVPVLIINRNISLT